MLSLSDQSPARLQRPDGAQPITTLGSGHQVTLPAKGETERMQLSAAVPVKQNVSRGTMSLIRVHYLDGLYTQNVIAQHLFIRMVLLR